MTLEAVIEAIFAIVTNTPFLARNPGTVLSFYRGKAPATRVPFCCVLQGVITVLQGALCTFQKLIDSTLTPTCSEDPLKLLIHIE